MEIFIYYVLPNLVMFGGLFIIGKLVERSSWYVIENWDTLEKKFSKKC